MFEPHRFGLFVVAALVLLVIPGPSVLYITARSIDQGRRAGLASAFGTALGNLVLAVGAAAGLSAILASSAVAFSVVKYLGAAYLVYLGIRRLLSKEDHTAAVVERQRLSRIFMQGTYVAVTNPKTALFFLAFVPQFVGGPGGDIWEQTLFLGLTLVGMGICTDTIYALLTGTAGNWLRQRTTFQMGQRYVSGGIYLTLGVVAAFAGFRER